LTTTLLFSYSYVIKSRTSFAGHFDGHADQAVQCRAHYPVHQVLGYLRYHWTLPSSKYSPRITPADLKVIDFGVKN
jgi:hypothetical protein